MNNEEIISSIRDLQRGSKQSLGLVLLGVLFLAASITYSFLRLQPLQRQISELKESISQLEAKKAELVGFASAVDAAAKPLTTPTPDAVGWIYVGLMSSSGTWASKSDRVASSDEPSALSAGSTLSTTGNTSLVDDLDGTSKETPASAGGLPKSKFFIKPKTTLTVLEIRQQGTIGSGKLIWVKVQANSTDLLEVKG